MGPLQAVPTAESRPHSGRIRPSVSRAAGPSHPDGTMNLTTRERQVAALIARGLTSREIAAELVVSARTVDTYADRIRSKLGLRSRLGIAVWAVTIGLVPVRPVTI